MPTEGFFSWNPFVPQILACPLKGACQAGPAAQQSDVQALMDKALRARGRSSSRTRRRLQRRLLQAAAESASGDGSNSSGSGAQPQQLIPTPRTWALFGYENMIANAWTADPTDGVPVLADIDYQQLLAGWHALQCSPG